MTIGYRECVTTILLSFALASGAYPCTRTAPVSAADMLAQADAIVRATAIGVADPAPSQRRGRETGIVRFEVLEMLKGERPLATLLLAGRLVDHDDFNDHSPPHQVRPSGRSGSCYTDEYRAGREYLLLLKKSTEDVFWTTRWYPLGPVNEQLTGPEDAWLRWVRANVK